jgi:hypothetical protein
LEETHGRNYGSRQTSDVTGLEFDPTYRPRRIGSQWVGFDLTGGTLNAAARSPAHFPDPCLVRDVGGKHVNQFKAGLRLSTGVIAGRRDKLKGTIQRVRLPCMGGGNAILAAMAQACLKGKDGTDWRWGWRPSGDRKVSP